MGLGTPVGNPCEILLAVPLGATQPAEGMPPTGMLQFNMNPGIFPAIEVIWKVEMVSNSHPYPARTAVFLSGDQAIPRRGPNDPRLLFLYQPSALTKLTGPCEPPIGRSGTRVCLASEGGGLISHRTPAFNTRLGRMCHSS